MPQDSPIITIPNLLPKDAGDFFLNQAELIHLSQHKKIPLYPSEFVEFFVHISPDEPFVFNGREYLREPYDCDAPEVLVVAGRQVEKTCEENTHVLLQNGSTKTIAEIVVGDDVVGLAGPGGACTSVAKVTWKSRRYRKSCLRVTTRQGHVAILGGTHPVRCWNSWVPASNLRQGSRIATVRRGGEFTSRCCLLDDWISFVAFMIGDGHCSRYLSFCKSRGTPVHTEFLQILRRLCWSHKIYPKKGSHSDDIRVLGQAPRDVLKGAGVLHCLSSAKRLPSWFWDLTREQTALFLNRLWSTDGSAKQRSRSLYALVYGTTSKGLAFDVQQALWKFGIPSRIRVQTPKAYKGTDKRSYLVRVETQDGVYRFLTEIGALGKTECLSIPTTNSNNNRDTIPKEVNDDIKRLYGSARGWGASTSLHRVGLRLSLKYPPTRKKLKQYLTFLNDEGVTTFPLDQHLGEDLYWDEVVSIEEVGEKWCYDITTTLDSFVADGLITHNSTTLGNLCIHGAITCSGIRVLYVSPSDRQTKTFSYERIRHPLMISPRLKEFISPTSMNVYDQIFLNGSVVKLRSAYLSPDRLRGERADVVIIDEYQDILSENIPVIRECTFHANPIWRRFINGGTPKTLDNPINKLWLKSTMTELMFPCRAHGESTKPYTWYWFPIRENCLGRRGLICPRCGKGVYHLDPESIWVDTAPKPEDKKVRGYHVPQPITPMAHRPRAEGAARSDWEELLIKRERYPRGKFMNEVMGESYDHGVRPLAESDFISNQVSHWIMSPEQLRHMMLQSRTRDVYAGVDWGGEDFSYTVIVLGTYEKTAGSSRFFEFYWHRFEGKDSDKEIQLEKIYDLLRGFNVRLCLGDYGMGQYQNDYLVRRLGAKKYLRLQYIGRQTAGKLVWRKKLGWFTGYKSALVTDYVNTIKKGKVALPSWTVFGDPYGTDFLNVRGEYNERRDEMCYVHGTESPVDSMHAGLYCLMASLRDHPRPDITHLVIDDSIADAELEDQGSTGVLLV